MDLLNFEITIIASGDEGDIINSLRHDFELMPYGSREIMRSQHDVCLLAKCQVRGIGHAIFKLNLLSYLLNLMGLDHKLTATFGNTIIKINVNSDPSIEAEVYFGIVDPLNKEGMVTVSIPA